MDKNTTLADNYVKITITAYPEYLCVVRAVFLKSSHIMQMPPEDADGVTLALEEALTNVIRHSYGGPCSKPIIIEMSRCDGKGDKSAALQIQIRDFGKKVDPATIKSRDLDDVRPGGLGVHIIQSVMDEVEYQPMNDGGMRLRLLKLYKPTPIDGPCSEKKIHRSTHSSK